jgi:predicted ATPase
MSQTEASSTLTTVLRRLRLRNFKTWQDTGDLSLAPLTVLFGPNSSGKSSINHFLMMLKQTVRSPDRNAVFYFGDATSAVDLGSFRDVIFGHDLARTLRFEQEWQLAAPLQIRDPRTGRRYSGDRLGFECEVSQPPPSRATRSEGFSYRLSTANGPVLEVDLNRDEKRTDRWRLDAEHYTLVRNPGRAWELPKPIQFYGFPSEAAVYYQNTAFLPDLELALEQQLDHMSYLGPLRSPPRRTYTWAGAVPEDVGWRGDSAVPALLAARGRGLNWTPKARRESIEAVVARWLQRLGLISTFSVHEISPELNLYEVKVRVQSRGQEVALTDVGFGVSQVLPVVVQAFYAPPYSTVLIEQPELHLHPAAQSALADLFIDAITAREDAVPRSVQLLVESHSEHLLRRLQRRIAEQRVDPDQVALYFCRQTLTGARIERLDVDLFGDIHNWPPNFFGDELEDVSVQAERSTARRLKAKAQA